MPVQLPLVLVVAPPAGGVGSTGGEVAHQIRMLDGFAVLRGSRAVTPPAGRAANLLKVVALSPGGIHAERLIETLWPGVSADRGRRRLRTTLNRLRQTCGEVIVREGESLALAEGVDVDALRFEREASRCLENPGPPDALDRARELVEGYGELLPGDPYEAWAAGPRERLRRLYVKLLDLLAADAEQRGRVAEAVRHLERAIEADPYDDERYLRAARLLLERGHHAHAGRVLARARDVLGELGLKPSKAMLELEQRLRE